MKYPVLRPLAVLLLLSFAASCSKPDWKDVWGDHPSIPKCDLAAYSLTIYPQVTHPFLFTKVYDHSGRFVKSIDASVFNIREPEGLNRYQLKVEFKGRNLYLVNLLNPADTCMKVILDKYGRPEAATANENLGSYEFRYINNRYP